MVTMLDNPKNILFLFQNIANKMTEVQCPIIAA